MNNIDHEELAKNIVTSFDGMRTIDVQSILRYALEYSGENSIVTISSDGGKPSSLSGICSD
jgi:phosphoenolpyruvate carboxylase